MPIQPPSSQDEPSGFDPGQESPPIRFGVFGDSNVGPGLLGCSGLAAGDGELQSGVGVLGVNIAAQGVGVHGVCRRGTGVTGRGGGEGAGVSGTADRGPGVSGTSRQGPGVSGSGVGSAAGVAGAADAGPGVSGTSRQGPGVSGTGTQGPGVQGQGGESSAGVSGTGTAGPGVAGRSAQGPGVSGTGTAGPGVSGTSVQGPGLTGESTLGVGVQGKGGPTEAGVVGTSDETTPDDEGGVGIGTGVLGTVTLGDGVAGFSTEGHGVTGRSTDGTGLVGSSVTGVGVYGESGDDAFELGLGLPPGRFGVVAVGDVGLLATGVSMAADFIGDVHVSGTINKSACSFRIDHPLDPENRVLSHCSVESSERKNVYDGTVTLDADGRAAVELPDWFEALNEDFCYQLTALGAPAPELHVSREVSDNSFAVAGGGPGQRVSWLVTGVRSDAWARGHPLVTEEEKSPAEQGFFLHPGEHGEPPERGIAAARRQVQLSR